MISGWARAADVVPSDRALNDFTRTLRTELARRLHS
jgi:hypothetical protein